MTTFDDWHKELISDYQWYSLLRMYKEETIKKAAEKVFAQLVADKVVDLRPMSENRKHVYNIVTKNPGDKEIRKDWYNVEKEKKEAEEKKEWVPLTGEARAKKLAEFKAMVDAAPKAFTTPKMSAQEIANEGDWLPKKEKPFVRSEFETRMALEEHKRKANDARRKLFLDAYPDASEEEIEAYLLKFKAI
jgi:hypothetical protein